MKRNEVNEKIKETIELLKDQKEPYKSLAFPVILSKLLRDEKTQTDKTTSSSESPTTKLDKNMSSHGLEELAKQCKINTSEIENVISINKNLIQVISPLSGSEPEKQIQVSRLVLLSYDLVFSKEWVDAITLKKCVDISGVGDLKNFARTLKNNYKQFRKRGGTKNAEYKIIGPGRLMAINDFQLLAKGEQANH